MLACKLREADQRHSENQQKKKLQKKQKNNNQSKNKAKQKETKKNRCGCCAVHTCSNKAHSCPTISEKNKIKNQATKKRVCAVKRNKEGKEAEKKQCTTTSFPFFAFPFFFAVHTLSSCCCSVSLAFVFIFPTFLASPSPSTHPPLHACTPTQTHRHTRIHHAEAGDCAAGGRGRGKRPDVQLRSPRGPA